MKTICRGRYAECRIASEGEQCPLIREVPLCCSGRNIPYLILLTIWFSPGHLTSGHRYLSPRFPKSSFEGRADALHPPPKALISWTLSVILLPSMVIALLSLLSAVT